MSHEEQVKAMEKQISYLKHSTETLKKLAEIELSVAQAEEEMNTRRQEMRDAIKKPMDLKLLGSDAADDEIAEQFRQIIFGRKP